MLFTLKRNIQSHCQTQWYFRLFSYLSRYKADAYRKELICKLHSNQSHSANYGNILKSHYSENTYCGKKVPLILRNTKWKHKKKKKSKCNVKFSYSSSAWNLKKLNWTVYNQFKNIHKIIYLTNLKYFSKKESYQN